MMEDEEISITSSTKVDNPDLDWSNFYGTLDSVIDSEIPLFVDFVKSRTVSSLYYQGVQFQATDLIADESDIQESTYAGVEESWLQQNYYQAFITMKQSLVMDVNPVPKLRAVDRASTDATDTLTTRQAVSAILSEVDLDNLVPTELMNLHIFGNSWRFTMPEPQPEDDLGLVFCPVCQSLMVENYCQVCGTDGNMQEADTDHKINVEVIEPWWVLPIPMIAKTQDEIGILIRVQIVPRHIVKRQLNTMLPGNEINVEPENTIAQGVLPTEGYAQHLSAINRLFRLAREITAESRTFGRLYTSSYGTYGLGMSRHMARYYVQIWVRDKTLNDEHGDMVLHFLEGRFVGGSRHKIDDHWTRFVNRIVRGRFYGDGESEFENSQDAINNLNSLAYSSAQTRSFSQTILARDFLNTDDFQRMPNSIIATPSASAGATDVDLSKIFLNIPGQPITGDVKELRDHCISYGQMAMGIFPVLFGQLPPGVEAYKAIEILRSNSLRAQRPMLHNWYTAHLSWIVQALKIARDYWKKERDSRLNDIRFPIDPQKIDADVSFQLDKALIVPTGEQEKRSRTIMGMQLNLIDPTDPLNRLQLLTELGLENYEQALISEIETQNREIEKIISGKQAIAILPKADNHLIHYHIVRNFLRSDYGRYLKKESLLVYQLIESHGLVHAFIADGKIEDAVNEITKSGILSFLLDEDGQQMSPDRLMAQLEQMKEQTLRDREREKLIGATLPDAAGQIAEQQRPQPPQTPQPPQPPTGAGGTPNSVPPAPPPGASIEQVIAAMGGLPGAQPPTGGK